MFTSTRYFASAALLLALLGSAAAKEKLTIDSKFEETVKVLGYDYEVVSDGIVEVLVPINEKQARRVFLNSKITKDSGKEQRTIFSFCEFYDGEVPAAAAAIIKLTNKHSKLGQYLTLDAGNGKKAVVYIILVDADASSESLGKSVKLVFDQASGMSAILANLDSR